MENKLRIGIAGCGHWGKNYVRVFNDMQNVTLAGIADTSAQARDRMKSLYPNIPMYESHEALIEKGTLDALVVATVASTHFEIIQKAFDSNLDVLAEKPVTLDLDQAEKLCEQANKQNRILMTAHTFLYNSSVRKLKELLDDGTAGEIYYIKSRRTHLGLIREDVNVVWDLAPHDISMFMYLLGEIPDSVQAMGRRILRDDREDVAFINLHFPSGTVANIQVSWADANKERVLDLVGSKSRIVFDDINLQEPIRIFQKGVAIEEDRAKTFGDFNYLFRDGDILSPKISMQEPLGALCEAFIHSITTRTPPLSDGKFGRDVIDVLCRIQQQFDQA